MNAVACAEETAAKGRGLLLGWWIWPLLGIIFLPWTTLAFLIAWQPGGLNGNWDALLIVLGVALDIVTYMHRFAAKAVRRSPRY